MRLTIDEKEAGAIEASFQRLHELLDAISVSEDGRGTFYIQDEDIWRLDEAQTIVEENLQHVFDSL